MKICTKCKLEKPESEFYKDKHYKEGLHSKCKDCCRRYVQNLWKKNPGYHKRQMDNSREYRRKNLKKCKEKVAQYYQKNKERLQKCATDRWENLTKEERWEKNLKGSYGITANDYYTILEEQKGECIICHSISNKKLVVDHSHTTGKVRGLLCERCNRLVGQIENSPQSVIEGVIEYARKN